MRKLALPLIGGTSLVLFALATARACASPPTLFAEAKGYVENIVDPGFESSTLSPWNNSQGYFEDGEGDFTYVNLGFITSTHHTGVHGFDMEVGGPGGGGTLAVCDLQQWLPQPVSASSIVNASVWGLSADNTLYVTIHYSDGTGSGAEFQFDAASAPKTGGWQQWNFLSIIDKSKSIVGIEFSADSWAGDDIVIDDTELLSYYPFLNLHV